MDLVFELPILGSSLGSGVSTRRGDRHFWVTSTTRKHTFANFTIYVYSVFEPKVRVDNNGIHGKYKNNRIRKNV